MTLAGCGVFVMKSPPHQEKRGATQGSDKNMSKKVAKVYKILLPRMDVIFKLLFGDKRNIEILKDFLKSILDLPHDEYDNLTLEDTHIKRESLKDKLGIVDVRLTTHWN